MSWGHRLAEGLSSLQRRVPWCPVCPGRWKTASVVKKVSPWQHSRFQNLNHLLDFAALLLSFKQGPLGTPHT